MAEKTFRLSVVTPERIFFEGSVRSMQVPGGAGPMGILVNHAPLISTLLPGRLIVTDPEQVRRSYTIGSGFLSILKNEVTVLTESIQAE